MVTLCEFDPVTSQELSDIIRGTTMKTSQLDPLPATVLKQYLDILLPALTKIVNLLIGRRIIPVCMKEALLDPLLNQSSLDHELFPNYRPISNIMFTSKSCERVVALQVNDYRHDNKLVESFQSAYKVGHSTESALSRVQNDISRSIDDDKCVVLLLLNLSATFDRVQHQTLLIGLYHRFGIQGVALQ